MANTNSGAYGLTLLCPIRDKILDGHSGAVLTRNYIDTLGVNERSPLAKVPNTFLARFYVLGDVFYQGGPCEEDHLKSKYLGFTCNFYGNDLVEYLRGFWREAEEDARKIWKYCYGFESIKNEDDFIAYIKSCQLKTTFYFNGSVDEGEMDVSLNDHLKDLYLKQEFGEFVWSHQGKSTAEIRQSFLEFLDRTKPDQSTPRWAPGTSKVANT